ncbi:hypothetical protein AYI69_g4742 [Smittium culicis]|uniref:Uncharacterized protein n=1 Tax=Smittium culicis TaxID=133412 RepID=A0A1R1YB49_9FUNG|nr:hypothetical protein AYI69_g4742 [Smittium culicis]
MPLTDLDVYPELIEALPSIEDDFFRTPLTEEERKETIQSFLRSSSMNYHPPPLNDSASSAMKKVDAYIHGIQIALAQATRPIDYYVHRITQDNLQANSEDPHILSANTTRVLLANIAATVTQGRLDNLHKGIELPVIPQQLIEPETKPLMDQEKLEALIASKKPEKRPRVRKPFRGRQKYGTQNSTGSKIAQKINHGSCNYARHKNWNCKARIPRRTKKAILLSKAAFIKILERFDEESAATPKETSDGATTTETSSKTAQEENGSRRTHIPDNRSGITIDQESDRGSEDTRSGILQQSVHKGPQKGSFEITEDWENDSEEPSEFHRQGASNFNCITLWTPHFTPTLRTEKYMFVEEECMDIDGDIDRAGNSESTILGHSTDIMEWPPIPPRDTRARIFYGFERLFMGNSCGIQILIRIMESSGCTDGHQLQRIFKMLYALRLKSFIGRSVLVYSENTTTMAYFRKFGGKTSIQLLMIYGMNLETLFRYEYTLKIHEIPSVMNPADDKSRLTSQTECSISEQAFLELSKLYITHDMEFFASRENKKINRNGTTLTVAIHKPNIASYTEISEGTTNNNADYSSVENCSMVPRSTEVINSPAITTTSNNGSARSKKRKISAAEQQELVSHGMENQQCILKAQGLSDTAVDIIISNQRAVKRRSRYHSIQQQFLDWHLSNNNTTEIQANIIVNFLAHIFTTKKLSTNTFRVYKSATFNLVADSKSMENSPCMS